MTPTEDDIMTAVAQEKQTVEAIGAAQGTQSAMDSRPVAGGELTIRLALSPGLITMIAAPVTVLVTMLVGWVVLKSLSMPVHVPEMVAAGIVNTVGGMLAALPIFILMKKGAAAIAQGALFGIAIRVGAILMGMVLAGAGGWGLDRMCLVYWVMACYFPLLMVETATVAWLSHKARC